jgi:WD40 repeat protein
MKKKSFAMIRRPVFRIISFSLLATLMSCLGTPTYAQSAKPEAFPVASTALQPPPYQPRLVTQLGHSFKIASVAFSLDGRYVLTGSGDKTARLWDVETGREVRKFEGHRETISSVAFSPDGRYVLTGSEDSTARLWDLKTGKEVRKFKGSEFMGSSVAFSADGRHVLREGDDHIGHYTALLQDLKTGKEVKRFEGHAQQISSLASSPNARYVLTGSWDKTARLWNVETGKEVKRFEGHADRISSVAFSPDGRYVLTGSGDKTARLWDVETGKEVKRFQGHANGISSVAFSPDGRYVLTGSEDKTARLWDIETGKEVRKFKGHADWILCVAFSPDGRYVLTGSGDKTARLWDRKTGKEVRRFEGHADRISSVAFSPDDRYVLTGSGDKTARLWDVETGQEVRRFEGHAKVVSSVAFSPDGRYVLTGSEDKTARLWDVETGQEVRRFEGHAKVVSSVAFSPDGRYVLTGSEDKTARLWDVETGQEVRQFKGHAWAIKCVAFSPKGHYVLTGSYDGTARLWDVKTGKEVRRFGEEQDMGRIIIFSVAFSPDGRYVLTGNNHWLAFLWDVETEKEVKTFEGHALVVYSVAFSPDGRYVLTGSGDKTARLWDPKTGKEVRRFEGHANWIYSVVFSSDSRYALTGASDGTVQLWDLDKKEELTSLISFTDGTWAVVTPDGRFDSSNLEETKDFSWVMPDDPIRPLPIETFMRDYYEPRLLPRVLKGEQFKPIRPLGELNRVQPGVKIVKVEQGGSPDIVKVTVEVSAAEGTFQRDGKDVVMKTGVHDLRLYRNGQLVAQWPEASEMTCKCLDTTSTDELNAWRKATEIKLDQSGKATKMFTVRLPRRDDLKEVAFSAYAFNLDRVKSETARLPQPYKVPAGLSSAKGRAYVITVGVSGNEDMAWRLSFASEDAKLIQRTVGKKLKGSKRYEKVVPVCLITTPPGSGDPEAQEVCRELIQPTKENIKTVMDILASRKVEQPRLEQLPQGLRSVLRPVQPEDLVLLSFSSHGVTDKDGEFYLLPYDLGMESAGEVIPELLKRSISSQELSLWLGPVDAEQLVMVVDACHSAAAVEAGGFKPGPMGNPGLGQLSYDKGMPILAATQAADSAWAERYSLLSYALAEEGIGEKQLGLNDALRYAEHRVPKLYEEKMGKEEKKKIQEPKLFEFRR